MAKYAELVGKRVEVHYRAGDICLPATGTLAADSGKSIFLEETLKPNGRMRTFRWEIPYPYIIQVVEVTDPAVSVSTTDPVEAARILGIPSAKPRR